MHQGRFELAIFEARRAVEIKDSARNRLQLGKALLAAERPLEAVAQQREALKRRPDYAWAQAELGLALLIAGHHEEAADAYQRRMELDDPPSFYMVLHYHMALQHLGRDEEARRLLARHAGRAEESWEHHLLAFHSGNLRSEELLARAANECQRAEAHFYVGYQQLLEGRTQAARQSVEENLKTKLYCFQEAPFARVKVGQLRKAPR